MDWEAVGRFTLETAVGAGLQKFIKNDGGLGKMIAKTAAGGAGVGALSEASRGNNSVEGWTKGVLLGGGGAVAGWGLGRVGGWGLGAAAKRPIGQLAKHEEKFSGARSRLDRVRTTARETRDDLRTLQNRNGLLVRNKTVAAKQAEMDKAVGQLKSARRSFEQARKVRNASQQKVDRYNKVGKSFNEGWGSRTLVGLGNSTVRALNRPGSNPDQKGGGGEKKQPPTAAESLTWDGAAPARARGLM